MRGQICGKSVLHTNHKANLVTLFCTPVNIFEQPMIFFFSTKVEAVKQK